jgi:hypothetical protein
MAIVINGSGSITGISAGGLPDGSVTADDIANSAVTAAKLADTLDLTGKTVTLPAGVGGKVLQVLNAYKTDTQSFGPSTTFSDITGLSITITPTSASSKFLIYFSVNMGGGADATHGYVRINRNGTVIGQADAASNRTTASGTVVNTSVGGQTIPTTIMYLDSPATGSAITYKLSATANANAAGTIWVNRSTRDTDLVGYDGRGTSSLVVMEIAA